MGNQSDVSIKDADEANAEYEHAFVERFRPCLERLQAAVTLARIQEVPLANACYRSSLASTINELADWFEREAAANFKQRSDGAPR